MALPGSSGAQGLPSDPEADSPPGVVYEIPVEKGRRDAAPRRGSEPETSIRSENNFGTSSEVPGVGVGGETASGETAGGETATGDGGEGADEDGNASGGSGSSGSGSSDPGAVEDIARDTGGTTAAAADGPSEGVVYPLLAVLVAVGAAIGLFAGHRARHGSRG